MRQIKLILGEFFLRRFEKQNHWICTDENVKNIAEKSLYMALLLKWILCLNLNNKTMLEKRRWKISWGIRKTHVTLCKRKNKNPSRFPYFSQISINSCAFSVLQTFLSSLFRLPLLITWQQLSLSFFVEPEFQNCLSKLSSSKQSKATVKNLFPSIFLQAKRKPQISFAISFWFD